MNVTRLKNIFDGPLTLPHQRAEHRETEKKKDLEAYDALAQKVAQIIQLPARYRERWRRTYRKMTEHKSELEENGSVHLKRPDSDIYVLKFRRNKGGQRVQSAIHLGPIEVAHTAIIVLDIWRTDDTIADLTGQAPKQDPGDVLRRAG